MTPADRRLVALAALFAPAAAGLLLRRLAGPASEALAQAAVHLAGRPRAERLAALAEGLGHLRPPEEAAGLLAAAISAERIAVARVLRDRIPFELRPRDRPPPPSRGPASGLLRRACAELVSALVES
jgi:hypothetical protein